MTRRPVATICRVLGMGRATAYRPGKPRARRYERRDDPVVYAQLRDVLRDRGSYGYRRARVLVQRAYGVRYNRKRIQRVMRMTGLSLPIRGRRHNGRPHRGRVTQEQPDRRWCTDGFEILCWNGQIVCAAFALDCCDREAMAHVARIGDLTSADIQRLMRKAVFGRFGAAGPPSPVQWLSDNGSVFTALETVIEAERLNLVPITTPVASPESNGMAEAFVNTLRRDYIDGADLSTAAKVIEQMAGWIADYNGFAPHSALGEKSPVEYRRELVTT